MTVERATHILGKKKKKKYRMKHLKENFKQMKLNTFYKNIKQWVFFFRIDDDKECVSLRGPPQSTFIFAHIVYYFLFCFVTHNSWFTQSACVSHSSAPFYLESYNEKFNLIKNFQWTFMCVATKPNHVLKIPCMH